MPREPIDNQVISLLSATPTLTRRQLADELGRKYDTIQRVLVRLQKTPARVVEGFVISDQQLPGLVNYWIMIQTRFAPPTDEPTKTKSKRKESNDTRSYQDDLCERIQRKITSTDWRRQGLVFRRIDILFGADWDLVLLVSAKSAEQIQKLVTVFLRGPECPEVVGTRTAWSTKTYSPDLGATDGAEKPAKTPA